MDRVIIVGGGPVGLALSLILARYNVPTLVLEARSAPTPQNESRAITWMPRALEMLDWLGLGERFAATGLRRATHEFWSSHRHLLSLAFDKVDSPHPYTLQLTQHDTEVLLEEAALATGYVELRRGHHVRQLKQDKHYASMLVESDEGAYEVSAPWAVGADGARSDIRHMLGIEATWRDYGTRSAVADFEMQCTLPKDASRIVLDPHRPYGFFYFAPGRWRFIYRINKGEDPGALTTEAAATDLLRATLPGADIQRFLWASAFNLRQGQSVAYRQGRWLLAGDAAHAMGPSAGAGMMIGLLGAWRLGWRLALAAKAHTKAEALLDDYDREQHAAAEDIQKANAMIFRNMAITSPMTGAVRSVGLRAVSHLPSVVHRMTEREALVAQVLPVSGAADAARGGAWHLVERLGNWETGRRVPTTALSCTGYSHVLIPIGLSSAEAEQDLFQGLRAAVPVPVEIAPARPGGADPWRVPGAERIAVALVRPDQHVAAIYQA